MKHVKLLLITVATLLAAAHAKADDWNYITTSGDYYYGMGTSDTEEKADKTALAALAGMIATNVTSGFDRFPPLPEHGTNRVS